MKGDAIDFMVMDHWRRGRLQVLGIAPDENLEPRERLGKLKCTLGMVKEERDGAAQGTFSQRWPEFRTPDGILVQRAFLELDAHRRMLMDARWTLDRFAPIKMRADYVGLTVTQFWKEVEGLKGFLDGFMRSAALPREEEAA